MSLSVSGRAVDPFFSDNLDLDLRHERRLRPVSDGADFLGYIVRPHYRLVRRRVVGNLREKLAAFAREYISGSGLRLPPGPRERLRAVLASYLGHFAHADAHRLVRRLFDEHPWLDQLFGLVERPSGGGAQTRSLQPHWQPPAVTSLRSQVAWFRRTFVPTLVLVQLGNRVAAFGPDLERLRQAVPWVERWRTTRVETRAGLDNGCSWPLSHMKGLGRGLRRAGQPYLFAAEEGYLPGGMKRRVLRYLFVGDGAAPWQGTAV
ncbi:MAG: hypothetical protein KFB96_01630 [Thiocapsa sp.]|uniref:hypothetical protein n=1 Tax=Thiocapsa sp. TaxID=2024551 RepID=UPI001BCD5DE9|nr:hypothetical protein [Thiocapsa sp.]QVL49257.1 MAG: hypothetical protein KFB96_01630 [Thiocapsa sp.]